MDKLKLYRKTINIFRNNLENISKNIDYFLEKTIEIGKTFGGPSLYFHKMALLKQQNDFLGKEHLNMIYAVMPSWGMHRMGSKGAKMVNYDIFESEIMKNKNELHELRNLNYKNVGVNTIVNLLTKNIHVSTTNSYLVSSSKVLHHIIPNLVSPIDRNYSIRFMRKTNDNFGKNAMNITNEEAYALIFLQEMYMFLNKNEEKISKYIIKIDDSNIYNSNFNTNMTKIFDNLIMTYIKENKGELFDENDWNMI